MLNYVLESGFATIDPCTGAGVRLGIIRLCRDLGEAIPPAALEETTDLDSLRFLHMDLLFRRQAARQARCAAEAARQRAEAVAREAGLSPELAARVAALRQGAAKRRASANYADRSADLQRELAAAGALDQAADQLVMGSPPAVVH